MIYINGAVLKVTKFPDKTSQVFIPDSVKRNNSINITWEFEGEEELSHLNQLVYLLGREVRKHLYMPFLPYGRQDKPPYDSLFPFIDLLKSMQFESIATLDAHSDVWPFLSISPRDYILKAFESSCSDVVIYPDKGAEDRYGDILPGISYVKERDPLTGNIISHFLGPNIRVGLENKKVLIVDDICDGGRTFTGIAKDLKDICPEINLYVTHGIFSKGIQVLKDSGIKRIFTHKGEVLC